MKRLIPYSIALCCLLPLSLVAHSDAEHSKEPQLTLTRAVLKEDPSLIVGKWVGMWDFCWDVEFHVSPHPEKAGSYKVLYRWKEEKESETFSEKTQSGRHLKWGAFKTGSITIEYKDKHHLVAIGRFKHFTRIAVLHKADE